MTRSGSCVRARRGGRHVVGDAAGEAGDTISRPISTADHGTTQCSALPSTAKCANAAQLEMSDQALATLLMQAEARAVRRRRGTHLANHLLSASRVHAAAGPSNTLILQHMVPGEPRRRSTRQGAQNPSPHGKPERCGCNRSALRARYSLPCCWPHRQLHPAACQHGRLRADEACCGSAARHEGCSPPVWPGGIDEFEEARGVALFGGAGPLALCHAAEGKEQKAHGSRAVMRHNLM